MYTQSNKLHLAVLQTLGVSVAMGATTHANAQTVAPAKIEKIQVTGSNIKRVDQEGSSPVVILTRQDIAKSGATSTSEVLRSLTGQSGGSFEERSFGTFAPGSAGISLRGLGQSATLVLVNGRRVAGYGFAQNAQDAFVDLNSLPLAAIERVEVLKDGASAIYGSDAIAGVVNVILRKDFDGVELTAFYGGANSKSQVNSNWDAKETKLTATVGYGNVAKDRFNVMASVDYFERTHVILKDRSFSRTADLRSRGGVDARSPASPTGTVFNYVTGLYQALPGCPAADLQVSAGGSICKFNFNQFATVIPGAKRIGITTNANIELTPTVNLFGDLSFNQSKSHSEFAPVPAAVPLSAGAPGSPVPSADIFVLRRLIEFGPRLADTESKTTRALVGIKGNYTGWDWETAYSYSKSDVEGNDGNRVRADLLSAAIGNGTFQFGRLNPSSVSDPLRFTPNATRKGVSTYKSFDVKGTTEITQLAGGALGLAIGAERRSQSIADTPDERVVRGLSSRETATAASGSRNEWSVFAEVGIPFAKGWDAQVAVRHDAYQGTPSSTNPKFAISWRPTTNLLVRTSYTTGFRAPGLQELYVAPTTTQVSIVDSRRCRAGVAAACGATQTNGRTGGNPNLKPEESKSYNIGFVWDVTQSLTASIDFYRVPQTNRIASNAQFVVDNETNPPVGASVTRAASPAPGVPGRITLITSPFINVSSQEVQGADLDLSYRMSLGSYGKLKLSTSVAYYDYLKQSSAPNAPAVNVIGTGGQGFSYSRVRSRTQAEWGVGDWNNILVMSYDRAYKEDDVAKLAVDPNALRTVAAYTTFDTQVAYSGFKGIKLIGGIRNLLDKDPPFKANSTEGYDVERDNPRGRFFYVQVNYAFK
jgi:iron complex outermembrane recepter protein